MSADDLADRLLIEGRVTVRAVRRQEALVIVEDFDGSTWRVGWRKGRKGWWCRCPAVGVCPHLLATQSVLDPEGWPEPAPPARDGGGGSGRETGGGGVARQSSPGVPPRGSTS